jgi:hypothetical protein
MEICCSQKRSRPAKCVTPAGLTAITSLLLAGQLALQPDIDLGTLGGHN